MPVPASSGWRASVAWTSARTGARSARRGAGGSASTAARRRRDGGEHVSERVVDAVEHARRLRARAGPWRGGTAGRLRTRPGEPRASRRSAPAEVERDDRRHLRRDVRGHAARARRPRRARGPRRGSPGGRPARGPGRRRPPASQTSAPASVCSSISARVSRSERVVAAISTWKRASAARRSPALAAPARRSTCCASRSRSASDARSAASSAAAPAIAARWSAEVAQLVDAQLGEPLEQARVGRLGRRVHERAAVAAAPRLHQPGAPQPDQRLAQRDGRDAQLRRQLRLGGELVAVAEHADADRVREPRSTSATRPRWSSGASTARRALVGRWLGIALDRLPMDS